MTGYVSNLYGEYDEKSFLLKVKDEGVKAGMELIYKSLELYYVTKNPDCPWKIKVCIYSALAYFISPLDLVPDVIPAAGYTDDLFVVAAAVIIAQIFIDERVKQRAYAGVVAIFGEKLAEKLRR
jgi:uncharacterized membrane protein YkvA (DUF1232 family)